jgi:putative PIN family toxin of toxin-antitoxin system
MKVTLDANIYISYLLSPEPHKTISQVVEACFGKKLELIVTQDLLEDLREGVQDSNYLKAHIPQQALDNLITTLTNYTDIKRAIDPTAYSRDVKDDDLITQSIS